MTLPVQAWTPEFIDQILIGGDRMCLHALTHKLVPDTSTLLVTHLPALAYSAQHTLLRVTYDPSYHWSCWRSFETEPPFWSLKHALTNFFTICYMCFKGLYGIYCEGEYEFESYYVFDSHPLDSSGIHGIYYEGKYEFESYYVFDSHPRDSSGIHGIYCEGKYQFESYYVFDSHPRDSSGIHGIYYEGKYEFESYYVFDSHPRDSSGIHGIYYEGKYEFESYYLFDSHPRDSSGSRNVNGAAVLIKIVDRPVFPRKPHLSFSVFAECRSI